MNAWRGQFTVERIGRTQYTVLGWVDTFETWQCALRKRIEACQDVTVDLQIGAKLVGEAAEGLGRRRPTFGPNGKHCC